MKKAFTILLAAATACVGAIGLTACKDEPIPEANGKDITLKVGVTDYEPMDYRDASGKWIGFDAELAQKVFGNLGYKVAFQEIDWGTKIITLKAREIDVIWNGMTVTDQLKENLTLSEPYLENRQYGLVKAENAANYTSVDSLTGKKVAVESGSAADSLIEEINCTKNKLETQSAAVMEVAAGTSDIAIVDYTMAKTLTAEGSDYYGTLVAVDLGFEVEEYAVGFRKVDTVLCEKVNAEIQALTESGYMRELAQKYGVENLLKG